MNTAFLSAIPAAPVQEQPVPARPAKPGRPVIDVEDVADNAPVEESEPTGDPDKADAFAEMLAAMISVATPAVETHVETVQPAAVESVTSTATDIPRDGAGSPLFAASFMTSTPDATGVATNTTSNSAVETSLPVAKFGVEATETKGSVGITGARIEISDAAAAELAALDIKAVDVAPEAASSTSQLDVSTGAVDETPTVETVQVGPHSTENKLPVVATRETTVESGAVQHDAVNVTEPVVAVDRPVTTESASDSAHDANANVSAPVKPEAVATKVHTSADQPAGTNAPVASESQKVEAQPAGASQAIPQNTTAVEEPYKSPPEPQADLEQSTDVKPASSPKSSSVNHRPVAGQAPNSIEPEAASIVTPVAPSAEVGVRKDVPRVRSAEPIAAAEKPKAAALDTEALGSTGTTTSQTSAANSSDVTNSQTNSAATSTPSHVSQQVLQALAAYEAELPQAGSRSFEMLLDPPELGRLLVQMSRTSKGVDVRISAENETVRSILETTGAEMQQSLQLSGFDLGQFSGSSSGGSFANGDEWVAAPSLQSFAAGGPVQSRSTQTPGSSAVNVMV